MKIQTKVGQLQNHGLEKGRIFTRKIMSDIQTIRKSQFEESLRKRKLQEK